MKSNPDVQKCKKGHSYYAKSHEYPCPLCRIEHLDGALSDIRALVTSCIPKDAVGKLREISESVLRRSLEKGIDFREPTYFKHDWEEKLYLARR